nr:retrovirus-related Pol polyprotein from transposon TNT 1-94 [Tanacetum cinerariifolium]
MKFEESLNVIFNKIPPPTKLSPLVDDDVGEEEAIENNIKVVNNNNNKDESVEVDEVVNIKESKNHPLEQVIENLNQRTALGDESWVVAMQEELDQCIANDVWDLVPLLKNQSIIGTKWVYKNKLDENGTVSRNKVLKKFGFEDSKPTKTPMSTEIKLTTDDKADSVDSTKYRGSVWMPLHSVLFSVIRPLHSLFVCALDMI